MMAAAAAEAQVAQWQQQQLMLQWQEKLGWGGFWLPQNPACWAAGHALRIEKVAYEKNVVLYLLQRMSLVGGDLGC
jgi:hypothetical protein